MSSKRSYSRFKQKQNSSVIKHKLCLEYNSLLNKLLLDVYNSYLDFSFNFYERLVSEESFFNDICSSVKTLCYEKSKDFISKYLNSDMCNTDSSFSASSKILKTVLDIYIEEILQYYNESCNTNFLSEMNKRVDSLSREECFKNLIALDNSYVKASFSKFLSLFNKVRVSAPYLNDIFMEECLPKLTMELKNEVVDLTISILDEICVLNSEDCNLYDAFNEIGSISAESDKYSKLEYISDYKKLNKLAEDNGFKYVRCKGDHGIYKNKNGLVVIPQGRPVGRGLSFKIQKSIFSLAS